VAVDAYTLAVGVDSSGVRQGSRDLAEFSGVASQAASVGGAFGKIISAHAAAIAAAVMAYLSYADALDEMSERTGIAADKLAGLEYVAAQTGTSLQSLVELLGRMTDKASDAANGSERATRVFRTMGISVTDATGALRSQEELLGDIADKFKSYADGSAKVALAQEVFGRGGRQLIPLLNQGRDGLAAMTEEYRKLGGITPEAARSMGAFNDSLAASKIQMQSLTGQFVQGLLPALEDMLRFMRDMAPAAKDVNTLGQQLGAWMKELLPYAYRLAGGFQALGTLIGASMAAIGLALKGEFALAMQTMRDALADVDAMEQRLEDGLAAAARANAQRAAEDRGFTPGRGGETAPGVAQGARERAKAKAEEDEATKALNKTMEKYADILAKLEDPQAEYKQAITELIPLIEAASLTEEQALKLMEYIGEKYDENAKAVQAWVDASVDGQTQMMNAVLSSTDAINAEAKAVEEQTRFYGLSKAAVTEATIAELEMQRAIIGSFEAYEGQIADIDAKIAALKRLAVAQRGFDETVSKSNAAKKATEEWTAFFNQVDKLAFDVFTNVFENGKNAFENLANTIKSTLMAALYQLVVRPWVINITAAITGQSGVAGALLGGGGGGGLGGIGELLSGLLGGGGGGPGILTSLASMGGGIGEFFGGFGGFLEGSAGFVGPLMEGATGAMGLLGTLGSALSTALPYIGLALMAASAFGLFDSKGGPKGGGYAGSAGLDLGPLFAGDNNRYFTPNDADSSLMKMVEASEKTYAALMERLGGKAGDVKFAYGYDTDPEGTASNRVHAGAWVNGTQVYNYESGDDSLGRDADKLKETLDLESKRALLAALQASDLPDAIATILNSVTASTGTAEQIDDVVAFAQAFNGLLDLFKDTDILTAGVDAFDRATMGMVGSIANAGWELRDLAGKFDGTTESTEALAAATAAYKQAAIEMVAQIQSIRVGLHESFGNLGDQLRITMLGNKDDDGDALYKFYQERADQLREQLKTETDPMEIARIVGQIQQYTTSAFNLLDPKEQEDMLQTFLDNLADVEELADQRLEDIQETIADAAKTTLDDIATMLNKFIEDLGKKNDDTAQKQDNAAEKQLRAAHVQMTAASKPIVVTINDTREVTG